MNKWLCVILGLVAFSISAAPASATALPITAVCPGTSDTGDREFTLVANSELAPLGDATVTCFDFGTGNLNDDEFSDPPWVLLDKDNDSAGICESCLTVTGISATFGTFTISSGAWASYPTLLIGFKTGEGQLDPDWAAFKLTGGITGGNWSVSGQQALSHANLWGSDEGGTTIQEVPEPTTLFLLGTGLVGTARLARRRRAEQKK